MSQSSTHSNQFSILQRSVTDTLEQDIQAVLNHANLPNPLAEACAYAMQSGKRVRPLLVASAYLTVQQAPDVDTHGNKLPNLPSSVRRAMLAVECLHAYSLIHDDLPCMDDDDLRRGQPTCHIRFGEATALLAGDVLQTLAFEVLTAQIEGFTDIDPVLVYALLDTFTPRARRMVSGQMQDLSAENKTVSQSELEAIHRDKTGALIEASVLMGGHCAAADTTQLANLRDFGSNIGLAFQVQDDVLDVTASTETLGKQAGSDDKLNKSTYVTLMGINNADTYAKRLFEQSKLIISKTFDTDTALLDVIIWLWQRKY